MQLRSLSRMLRMNLLIQPHFIAFYQQFQKNIVIILLIDFVDLVQDDIDINQMSQTNTGKPGQYFEEKKKGEMNEIKNALNGVINENDSKKGREVIRKVIGYMTLGMDASAVFSEMCRASFTNDEVMKKMIYFYLTTYAEDNADLAIMAVNTFKKDCKHTSSKIRGLALRNLCSFKSADYVNNVLPVIRELLNDFQPYVKKTAIMGLLKVFYVQPATILQDEGLISSLSLLIKDSDPLVSVNAFLALDEILVSEGGIPINMKMYLYLMRRLKEYNQWQQTCILDVLYRYTPDQQKEKQRYEIMGILWDKLKHSSTPLVLGSIKLILKLTEKKEELFRTIVEKIKAPLLTLMTGNENSGSYETMYVVLQHIEYVILHMNGKQYFEKDFKYFYCKVDEPTYIKSIKVKILGELANEYNLGDLLNQLNDYATDVDFEMARKSVKVLTDIALRLPEVSKALLINLDSYYRMDKPHLANEAMVSFHQILRKYPKLFPDVSRSIIEYRTNINQTESTKSLIWLLGSFAQSINQAPYILEEYIENQERFNALDTSVKEVLLTSVLQIFLKRPVETLRILSDLFKLIFQSDKSSMALLDHAAFYYLALQNNIEEVRKNFAAFEADMTRYKEELSDAAFDEDFNSLGILYKKKEGKYTKPYEYFVAMRNKELGLIQPEIEDQDEEGSESPLNEGQQQQDIGASVFDSIDADDLEEELVLTDKEFQSIWEQLEEGTSLNFVLRGEEPLTEEIVAELFRMWHVHTMASSEQQEGNILKFYLYAKDRRNSNYFCLELYVNNAENSLAISTKAKDEKSAALLNVYISSFLRENSLIE